MVQMVSYEMLTKNNELIKNHLMKLGFQLSKQNIQLSFDEIPQSPKQRPKVITINDLP